MFDILFEVGLLWNDEYIRTLIEHVKDCLPHNHAPTINWVARECSWNYIVRQMNEKFDRSFPFTSDELKVKWLSLDQIFRYIQKMIVLNSNAPKSSGWYADFIVVWPHYNAMLQFEAVYNKFRTELQESGQVKGPIEFTDYIEFFTDEDNTKYMKAVAVKSFLKECQGEFDQLNLYKLNFYQHESK